MRPTSCQVLLNTVCASRFAIRLSTYQGAGMVKASDKGARSSYLDRICCSDCDIALTMTFGADSAAQDIEKLSDARLFFLLRIAVAAEEARIEFFGQQRVLEAFHGPVEDGDGHLLIQIAAKLVAFHAETHKGHGAIGVLGQQETVDFALQGKIGPIVSEQRYAIRNPILVH